MRSLAFIRERSNQLLYDRDNEYSYMQPESGFNEQLDGLVLFNQTDSGFIHKWCSQTLNVLMRLDYLFNRSLNKETHSNFIQRLNNIQRQLVPNSNDYRSLFSRVGFILFFLLFLFIYLVCFFFFFYFCFILAQIIVSKFDSEVKKMASIEYLEDWQYVSLMSMFYVLNKFQISLRGDETLRFFNVLFELHRPRLLSYFKTLKDFFHDFKM